MVKQSSMLKASNVLLNLAWGSRGYSNDCSMVFAEGHNSSFLHKTAIGVDPMLGLVFMVL